MEPLHKPNHDRGISLSTALWLMGCGFILAATGSFVAYLRFHWPWWTVAVALGVGVGLIVIGLEQFLVRPLERLARGLNVQLPGSDFQFPPPPANLPAPIELRRVWRGLRLVQETQSQFRLAQQSNDSRLTALQRHARVLTAASRSLRPDAPLTQTAPSLLRDLASVLGVPAFYLVPLRRNAVVPVLGPAGTPEWADAIRESGFDPWKNVLAQDIPVAISMTSRAPGWAAGWSRRTLWVVPLVYYGRPLGILLALPTGADRAFTRDEQALLEALGPLLAAALSPPRRNEDRKRRPGERNDRMGAHDEDEADVASAGST